MSHVVHKEKKKISYITSIRDLSFNHLSEPINSEEKQGAQEFSLLSGQGIHLVYDIKIREIHGAPWKQKHPVITHQCTHTGWYRCVCIYCDVLQSTMIKYKQEQ